MNITELMTNVNRVLPELLSAHCFVNGALLPLSVVDNMGYEEFSLRSRINMPKKLFKYFPNTVATLGDGSNVNYSMLALKNNTVYMQTPSNFDDVYDSDINVDYDTYEKIRLLEFCKRCGSNLTEANTTQELGNEFVTAVYNSFIHYQDFEHFFTRNPESEIEALSNQLFQNSIAVEFLTDKDIGSIVKKVIFKSYEEYVQRLKNTFRVSCFASSPMSQLMWGGYADCHRGFCVEYTILPEVEEYHNLYANLYPMIYCKVRPDVSKQLVSRIDNNFDLDDLWKIYSQGALRKSFDWMYQGEWRLLLPMGNNSQTDFNMKFFPITKVYLGNRMAKKQRAEIIDICKNMGIPYIGVRRNPNVFEMEECPVKCEDCPRFGVE